MPYEGAFAQNESNSYQLKTPEKDLPKTKKQEKTFLQGAQEGVRAFFEGMFGEQSSVPTPGRSTYIGEQADIKQAKTPSHFTPSDGIAWMLGHFGNSEEALANDDVDAATPSMVDQSGSAWASNLGGLAQDIDNPTPPSGTGGGVGAQGLPNQGINIDNELGPKKYDLSSFMALADAWSDKPSNLAGSYKKPMSDEERMLIKKRMEQQAADRAYQVKRDDKLDAIKLAMIEDRKFRDAEKEQKNLSALSFRLKRDAKKNIRELAPEAGVTEGELHSMIFNKAQEYAAKNDIPLEEAYYQAVGAVQRNVGGGDSDG